MKFRFLCLLLLGASGAGAADSIDKWESSNFSLLPQSFQRDPHLMVLINTEFTVAGRKAPQASSNHPVYYQVLDGGEAEVGVIVAHDKPPAGEDLARVLHKTLASGGYLLASAKHPPTILVVYRWGSFNHLATLDSAEGPDGTPTGGGSDGATAAPTDDAEALNLVERAGLVGGTKFAVEVTQALRSGLPYLNLLAQKSNRYAFLMQQVYSDRYFVIATAYDFAAYTLKQKVPLWRTKISTDSRGVMMSESLPGLIAVAGPYFGHETDGPVRLSRPVISEGHVEIGESIVKGVLPPDTPIKPAPAPSHP